MKTAPLPLNKSIQVGECCEWWFENDSLIRIRSKGYLKTEEKLKRDFEQIRNQMSTHKVKIYYDASLIAPIEKKIRVLLETMLKEIGLALAVTSDSNIGRMVANIFFTLSKTEVPMQIFKNEQDAIRWLNRY